MISSYLLKAPNNAATAVTRYTGIGTQVTDTLASAASENVMPMAGTFQNLYSQRSAAVGAGNQLDLTVTKNGVDQTPTVNYSGGAQVTANDTTHTFSFNAGDTIGMKWVGTGTPTGGNQGWGFEISGTGMAILTGGTGVSSNSAASYMALQNSITMLAAPGGSVIPTAGTISNLYMTTSAAPGAAKSYTAVLVLNGVDQALTAQVAGAGVTTANDVTNSVAVAAGDQVYWKITPSGTPTSATVKLGAQFIPTTDGESIHTYTSSNNLAVSGNNYSVDGGATFSTVEANRAGTIPSVADLKKLYVALATAPGGATSYTATVRDAAANTTVTTTITGAAQTGNDTTHTATSAAGDYVAINLVGASTPTASALSWGFVSYIAPPATGTSSRMMMGMI